MKKRMLKAISALAISALFLPSLVTPIKVMAAEDTPSVIYSTIEGEGVEIAIADAITKGVKGTWYCNNEVLQLDENHVDTSEGTTARLKINSAATSQHMNIFKCITSASVEKVDEAQLYVISKDNFKDAEILVKDFEATIGSDLYAKNITLYIDKTPYPNFAALKFLENGTPVDKVRVKNGTYTYDLVDTVFGRQITAKITGVGDKVAPSIKYLGIKYNKADKYASEKTVEALAVDDNGLPEEAYYFETNELLASVVKALVLDGATADDLNGITWGKETEWKVVSECLATLFVRDKAGNIGYKDISITKISTVAPYITETSLGKEDGKAYINVNAKDPYNQKLEYRLNDGAWQDSGKLFGVKEGDNKVEVRNEAGIVASTTRTVYLSLYMGTEEGFSEDSLYNYIVVSPSSWTNKSVTVSLVLPDSLSAKLSSSPYSINGAAFSSSRSTTISNNGDTVQFQVKDLYGNTHTSKTFTVKNIDKEKPSIEVIAAEGSFTIRVADTGSGIEKVTVSSTSASNFVVWSSSSDGCTSNTVTYKAPSDGTYTFVVYDYAGNSSSASGTMAFYTEENGTAQTALKNAKGNLGSLRAGTGSASVLGSKRAAEQKTSGTKLSVSTSVDDVLLSEEEMRTYSDAGNSISPDLSEPEKLDVIREQDAALASAPQMLETYDIDNSNSKFLKGLFIFLLGIAAASIGIVIWINSEKKKERDDFSFRQ